MCFENICKYDQKYFRVLRTTPDPGLRDLSSAVLWNLSSCDSLKQIVIQESLQVLAKLTVRSEPKVFTNATGCLRNLSSAGAAVRKRLRSFKGNNNLGFFLHKIKINIFRIHSNPIGYRPSGNQ